MFKRISAGVVCLSVLMWCVLAPGAYGSMPVPVKDKTIWEKTTDWFATLGKSKKEKRIILKKRKAERNRKNALKAIEQRRKAVARKK